MIQYPAHKKIDGNMPLRDPMSLQEAMDVKPGDQVYYIEVKSPTKLWDEYDERRSNPLAPLTVSDVAYITRSTKVKFQDRGLLNQNTLIDLVKDVKITTQELGREFSYKAYSLVR